MEAAPQQRAITLTSAASRHCRLSGQGPGQHGVEDALAGHRIDQGQRVAGEQDPPIERRGDGTRTAASRCARNVLGSGSTPGTSSASRFSSCDRGTGCPRKTSPYPTLARPSPIGKLQAYAGHRSPVIVMTCSPTHPGGTGRVPPDRHRHVARAVGRPTGQTTQRRLGPVRRDDGTRRQGLVEDDEVPRVTDRADAMAAKLRTPSASGGQDPRVQHGSGDDVRAAPHPSRRHVARR